PHHPKSNPGAARKIGIIDTNTKPSTTTHNRNIDQIISQNTDERTGRHRSRMERAAQAAP
ncbi:hypothetical protein, partial [Thauera sp. Sel9]|uniref:hypothetical protein n=1 Tax=Thauera sp. Sel9 TaxID=2974299 RepID=UPI0021E18357